MHSDHGIRLHMLPAVSDRRSGRYRSYDSNDYGSAHFTTYKDFTTKPHVLLWQFAGVSEGELNHFALALVF
jgi:hypothetical protein